MSFSEAESHQEEEGKGSASRACIVLFLAVSAVSDKSRSRLAECVFQLVSLSDVSRRRGDGTMVDVLEHTDVLMGPNNGLGHQTPVVTQNVSERLVESTSL